MSVDNKDSVLLVNMGLKIRKLREQSNLSQAQLGFEANLSRESINMLENGKLNISILKLEQIANTLNITVHQLLMFD